MRERQKVEELEKTKEAIKQLIQDAAVRTRKEVGRVQLGVTGSTQVLSIQTHPTIASSSESA